MSVLPLPKADAMPTAESRPVEVQVPADSAVARAYGHTDLADAWSIRLPAGASADPELLARFLFAQQGRWVAGLMRVRDAVVARVGLKTARQLRQNQDRRVEFFKIYDKSAREIILGEDDKHLDFRVSVLRRTETVAGDLAAHLVLSTVVHCHNRLGRTYLWLIGPFHRLVVKSSLRRAARAGWPRDPRPGRTDSAAAA